MSVSIIITCYNEERFIEQAIRSVLEQTAFNEISEVIVVDDGSTDSTPVILDRISSTEPLLRIIRTSNKGPSHARNQGISLSRSPLVAFLDGDDFWGPQKLERQLPAFTLSKVGLAYSDFVDFSSSDLSDARLVPARPYRPDDDDTLVKYFIHDAPVIPSSAIFRRVVFEDVGTFDETLRLNEDTDICLRVAERWHFQHVSGPLTYKRRHGGNLTSRLEALLPVSRELTRRYVERNPRLARFANKRMARRLARTGNDCIAHGARRKGIKYLVDAILSDPLFLRSYVYFMLAAVPGSSVRGTTKTIYHALVRASRRVHRLS